jgi:hypothetical protein
VVTTADAGCRACPLVVDPIYEKDATKARALLKKGGLSRIDHDKIEMFLLSCLRYEVVDGEPAIIELLSGAEVTPVCDPPIQYPIAYGWHYSYPPLNEVSIVRNSFTWMRSMMSMILLLWLMLICLYAMVAQPTFSPTMLVLEGTQQFRPH